MSEDTQVQQTEQTQVADNQPEQTTDPYEAQAREQGWKPQEEYEGEPGKWRDAKSFVERGELFGKIDTMGRELKETRKALKMLQEHHTKVKETEYNRALVELKALQKRHLEEGNADEYLQTTELLTDLKAEQKARQVAAELAPQPQGPDPRFTAWVDRNKWYASDNEMRQFADSVGLGYSKVNPGIDPEEVLDYVATQVKLRYKDKFENPNRNKPSAVEGRSTPTGAKGESIQLSEDERKVMNTFVRQGIMTKEEYLAEVKKLRG